MNLPLIITNFLATFGIHRQPFPNFGQQPPPGLGQPLPDDSEEPYIYRPNADLNNHLPSAGNRLRCGLTTPDDVPEPGNRVLGFWKIVGGRPAAINEFPWLVSIQVVNFRSASHLCGATVIGPDWLLTAAHCLDRVNHVNIWSIFGGGSAEALRIVAGVGDLFNNQGVIRSIQRIFIHPNYDSQRGVNDIALIKLNMPFELGSRSGPLINAICLPALGRMLTGTAVTIGWGAVKEDGKSSIHQVRAVDVPIVDPRKCLMAYGFRFQPSVMVCAGREGRDSCQGDSGGPLIRRDSSGRSTIIGVVSVGNGCGRRGYPGIYTRVDVYVDWINSIVGPMDYRG